MINGIDIDDNLLMNPTSFIPTRVSQNPKILEDREMLATVTKVYEDLTADVTIGRDIIGLSGKQFDKVPIKLNMGEGSLTTIFPQAIIQLPQEGDTVLLKLMNSRSQPYIDRTVANWTGLKKDLKISNFVLPYLENVKDWVWFHNSGTKWKVKSSGDFVADFLLGVKIEVVGRTVKIDLGTSIVTIDDTQILCESGSNKMTVTPTEASINALGSDITVDATGISIEQGSSKVTVGVSEVKAEHLNSKVTLSPISARVENGAFIEITPAGVNINGHLQVI